MITRLLWPSQLSERFIQPSQLAAEIGVSAGTIRNWCEQGSLPARRVGSRWHIHQTINLDGPVRDAVLGLLQAAHPALPSILMNPPPPSPPAVPEAVAP